MGRNASRLPSRPASRLASRRLKASRVRFSRKALQSAIRASARRAGQTEQTVLDTLQVELQRAGLQVRVARLLAGGRPALETLFVIARATKAPMEAFFEEAA